MKTKINRAAFSKINWTGLVIQTIGLLVIFDVIPLALEQPVTEITLIVGPAIIQIWRTFFTDNTVVARDTVL